MAAAPLSAATSPGSVLSDPCRSQSSPLPRDCQERRLRRDPPLADTPVILLTGNIDSPSVQRGGELGVQDHIVKTYPSVAQIAQGVLSRLGHAGPCPAPAGKA